jgi:hypothetical protein
VRPVSSRYDNGRCAIGVIMSYFGWNGKDDGDAERRLTAKSVALRRAGVNKESTDRDEQLRFDI